MAETILITGASSGFGKDMTHALRKAGHEVAASMRDPDGRNRATAQELSDIGAHIVDIDVTNDDSVQQGVATAVEKLGGLTVIVNNAARVAGTRRAPHN